MLQVYQRAGFFDEWNVLHVASHTDQGGAWRKVWVALRAALTIARWQVEGRISVLHVHTASGASFWRKLALAMPVLWSGTPVVMHVHGGAFCTFYQQSSPLQRCLILWSLKRSRMVLGLTDEWVRMLQEMAPGARVKCLFNPVELPVSPEPSLEAAPSRDLVLYLGLLDRKKGTHDLVRAFARLPPRLAKFTLVLAGTGDDAGVRTLARECGVEGRIQLPGWIGAEEKALLWPRTACLVLPSYAEGLPMSVLEAMAQGVPVLATAVGGLPEVVSPGVNGDLVQPGDVDALATSLERLLSDAALGFSLGREGRRFAEQRYAAPAVLRRLSEIYEELGVVRVAPQERPSRR